MTKTTKEQEQRPTGAEPVAETDAVVAWGVADRHESPWYAATAVIVAVLLYQALPSEFHLPEPRWLVPVIGVALLAPLVLARRTENFRGSTQTRLLSMSLIAVLNFVNIVSLALLIRLLLDKQTIPGDKLLISSAMIWTTNVIVFGLWYWELDRGGPYQRRTDKHRQPDFLFPQMATPHCSPADWAPDFVDYLYVAFTNATAFSPTDTMPLTNWAKLLMMVQSFTSLVTVGLVAARAVNILGP